MFSGSMLTTAPRRAVLVDPGRGLGDGTLFVRCRNDDGLATWEGDEHKPVQRRLTDSEPPAPVFDHLRCGSYLSSVISAASPRPAILRDELNASSHWYEMIIADTAAARAVTATMSQNTVASRLCLVPVPRPCREFSGLCGSIVARPSECGEKHTAHGSGHERPDKEGLVEGHG
jgi:hypothetical protein